MAVARGRHLATTVRRAPGETAAVAVLCLGTAWVALAPSMGPSREVSSWGPLTLAVAAAWWGLVIGHRVGSPWRSDGVVSVILALGPPKRWALAAVVGARAPELLIGLLVALSLGRAVFGNSTQLGVPFGLLLAGLAVAGGALGEAAEAGQSRTLRAGWWASFLGVPVLSTLVGRLWAPSAGPVCSSAMLSLSAAAVWLAALAAIALALWTPGVRSVSGTMGRRPFMFLESWPDVLATFAARVGVPRDACAVVWLAGMAGVRSRGRVTVVGGVLVLPVVSLLVQLPALKSMVSYLAGFASGAAAFAVFLAPVQLATDLRLIQGNPKRFAGWQFAGGDLVLGAVLGSAATVTLLQVSSVMIAGATLLLVPPPDAARTVLAAGTFAVCLVILPLATCQYAALNVVFTLSPRVAATVRGVGGQSQSPVSLYASMLLTFAVTVAVAVPAVIAGAAAVAGARLATGAIEAALLAGALAATFALVLQASLLTQVARHVGQTRIDLQGD